MKLKNSRLRNQRTMFYGSWTQSFASKTPYLMRVLTTSEERIPPPLRQRPVLPSPSELLCRPRLHERGVSWYKNGIPRTPSCCSIRKPLPGTQYDEPKQKRSGGNLQGEKRCFHIATEFQRILRIHLRSITYKGFSQSCKHSAMPVLKWTTPVVRQSCRKIEF